MNIVIIILTSCIIFFFLVAFYYLINKNTPVNLLSRNINKLTKCVKYNIFKKQFDLMYGFQIYFGLTKTRLLNKCNVVKETMCNMVNLYLVDDIVSNYYQQQIEKINSATLEIEKEIDEMSIIDDGSDYVLSQKGKVCFDKMNNKINKHITDFLVGNAKFYTFLKFNNEKEEPLTLEEFKKKQKIKKIISYVTSLIVSILISVLANYISSLIGL